MFGHITELETGQKSEKEQKSDLRSKSKKKHKKIFFKVDFFSIERSVSVSVGSSNFENSERLVFENFFEKLFVGGAAEPDFETESGMLRRNQVRKITDPVVWNLERKKSVNISF